MYYTERKPKNNKEERPGNEASQNGQNYGIYYKDEDVQLVQIASYDFFLSMLLVQWKIGHKWPLGMLNSFTFVKTFARTQQNFIQKVSLSLDQHLLLTGSWGWG